MPNEPALFPSEQAENVVIRSMTYTYIRNPCDTASLFLHYPLELLLPDSLRLHLCDRYLRF
jgi:hypothetical protein